MATPEIPLSLYLHFPWCVRKCPYCDFNSHGLRGEVPEDAYVDALLRDLDFELRQAPEPRPLRSIFMGGGTPSLFSGAGITRVLDGVRQRLQFVADIEITMEANPGTVDEGHFASYRAAGVNRLSIGVQSLDAERLKQLGRIHDPDQARRAVVVARAAGFDNINLDMMYALPGQTVAAADDDLQELISLQPDHISYYQLTLEPNTEFAARPPTLPDDDSAWEMQEQGQRRLAANDYCQYEVSAYARPGRQCRHNRNYWEFGDYLGVGAGAHAKRTTAGSIRRRARQKHPRRYMESAGTAQMLMEDRHIPREELPFEYMMNALRLNQGFGLVDYERRTGLERQSVALTLAAARDKGLLASDGARWQTTELGQRHLNELLTLFLN